MRAPFTWIFYPSHSTSRDRPDACWQARSAERQSFRDFEDRAAPDELGGLRTVPLVEPLPVTSFLASVGHRVRGTIVRSLIRNEAVRARGDCMSTAGPLDSAALR